MITVRKKFFDTLVTAMLPVAFIGMVFLNMLSFVLDGHQNELLRKSITIGGQAIAAVIITLKFFELWRKQMIPKKLQIGSVVIVFLFGGIYLWGFFVSRNNFSVISNAVIYGCYLVAATMALVVIITEKRIASFFRACKVYAIILSPVVLYYCIRFYLPSATYDVNNLGVLNYMPLSYGLLDFFLFLFFEPLCREQKDRKKQHFWINYALSLLYAIAIALSGTKGAIVCTLVGGILLAAYTVLTKKVDRAMLIMPIVAVLCVTMFSTVLTPGESRVLGFFEHILGQTSNGVLTGDELLQAENIINGIPMEVPTEMATVEPTEAETVAPTEAITVAPTEAITVAPTEAITVAPTEASTEALTEPLEIEKIDIKEFVLSGAAEEALIAGEITQEEYDQLCQISFNLQTSSTGSRIYLWRQALREIAIKPITGHGSYFFQNKYGTYPHNFFLEVATDFGIPVMLLISLLGMYVFIHLICLGLKNRYVGAFTIFVLTFLFQHMVSGSIYEYRVFLEYGFCVIILLQYDADLFLNKSKKKS